MYVPNRYMVIGKDRRIVEEFPRVAMAKNKSCPRVAPGARGGGGGWVENQCIVHIACSVPTRVEENKHR